MKQLIDSLEERLDNVATNSGIEVGSYVCVYR